MTTGAISGFGTILQVKDGNSVYTTIAEVTSISGPSISRNTIDATHMESASGWKDFIGGLKDGGELSIEANFLPGNATQQDLLDKLSSTDSDASFGVRIVWPDGAHTQTVTNVNTGDEKMTVVGHGFTTAQPVYFSTTGTLPVSTPQINAGTLYYARRTSADAFTVHLTSAAAVADTGAVNFTEAGTGTLSVITGTEWSVTAIVTGFEPKAGLDDKLTASIKMKLTGTPTFPA